MAQQTSVDLNQTEPNALTAIGAAERAKLFPKNDYNIANEYSSVNRDAIADGDSMGRGTGTFLDVYNVNAGTIDDVVERKNEIKINQYKYFIRKSYSIFRSRFKNFFSINSNGFTPSKTFMIEIICSFFKKG
jgi:hypothetical protein